MFTSNSQRQLKFVFGVTNYQPACESTLHIKKDVSGVSHCQKNYAYTMLRVVSSLPTFILSTHCEKLYSCWDFLNYNRQMIGIREAAATPRYRKNAIVSTWACVSVCFCSGPFFLSLNIQKFDDDAMNKWEISLQRGNIFSCYRFCRFSQHNSEASNK